jgi:aminopeptidase N
MEENSGQELDWFFAQWLHRTPSPVVNGGWKYNAVTKKLEIDLAQTQPGDAYRLPLEIGVDGTRVEKVTMTQKQQHFEIAAEKAPGAVTLDPNTWVLMDAHFAAR